jgi:hypothetical protein
MKLRFRRPWVMSLMLLVIAFAPRVIAAGAYVTVDEEHWIARSVDFVYGLLHGELATIPSVHPGVTGLWGFGSFLFARFFLGGDLAPLLEMRSEGYYDVPSLLPTAALYTALVTSVAVVVAYLLLRRLSGDRLAFLAALLIALDPYMLANCRRVHLDAILACTMYLSALAILVYAGWPDSPSPRRYVVVSAVFAGLAWLTKVTAVYLVPFTLLALGGRLLVTVRNWRQGGPTYRREAVSLVLWLAVAGLTFYVLWPAMWVKPAYALSELVRGVVWGVDVPHTGPGGVGDAAMQFFLGNVVVDPGPVYYLLTPLFRMPPVTFLFLPLSMIAVVVGQKRGLVRKPEALAFWLGVAYIVCYVSMISLGAKKLESYVLPIFAMIDTLAAVGLLACLRWLARRWQRWRTDDARPQIDSVLYGFSVVAIIVLSFPWLRLTPYYSAYFNPLLGGAKQASRVYAFGGGEGLDMAARYLNQKEDAATLVVSTPYDGAVFGYYFDGISEPPRRKHWSGSWLLSDYVISYLSYVQRDLPSPEAIEFFDTLEPEYVATINSTDYAKVYRVPPLVTDHVPPISHPANVNLGEQVTFLGYDLATERVESGGEIEVTLYWQRRQPLQVDYSVYLRLLNGVYDVWGQEDGGPLQGMMPTSIWDEDMVVADVRRLPILPGTPPGIYQIEVGVYDAATLRSLEPADPEDGLLLGPVEIVPATTARPPSPQVPLEANLDNQVRLLGYDLEGQFMAGDTLHLSLFWEALSPPSKDYTVFVHLMGEDGQIWGQQDSQPVTGYYPTSRWTQGEFIRDQYHLTIKEGAPAGLYTLQVGMYDASTSLRLPVLDEEGLPVGDTVVLGNFPLERP